MAEDESFEAALAALEAAVQRLESGELPLEESLQCFEQGVQSSLRCQQLLQRVETRVELLLQDQEGKLTLRPLAGESSETSP
jgi:exodeoxyribonuclease VII small subunit